MPRYFFNIVEGERKALLRDADGVELPNQSEAKKEAIGLARDISKHNLPTQTSRIVVSNSTGDEVTTIYLSDIRASKIPQWLERGLRIAICRRSLAKKPRFTILAVAFLGLVSPALVFLAGQETVSYQTASAPSEGNAIVAIRFVPKATADDIAKLLDDYKGTIVDGPRPGGFYRVRLGVPGTRESLSEIVGRLTQEKVVEFVATVE